MRATAAAMIKESKKIRSRLDNQESESENEGEGYEDEGVSEDEATQSDIDFIGKYDFI